MAFKPGDPKPDGSGRQKGTPNKKTFNARKMAEEIGCDPLEFLAWVMMNNWKALGFSSAYKTSVSTDDSKKDGKGKPKKKVTKTPHITLKMRIEAAIEIAQFVYPKLRSAEIDVEDEEKGSKVVTLAYNLERKKE